MNKGLEAAITKCTEIEDRFSAFTETLKQDGALSRKEKELISLAIAVVKGCEWCVRGHVTSALEQGTSPEQIIEAAALAVQMDGGPGRARMRQLALKSIVEYENGYRPQLVGTEWQLVKTS